MAMLVVSTALLASVTAQAQDIRAKAGQMLLLGFQGDSAAGDWPRGMAALIRDGKIGGLMYLKYNVASLNAVKSMNQMFLEAGGRVPPFIALDQEGGYIERLTEAVGFEEIPTAQWIAENRSPRQAENVYKSLASSLRALGFNLNFGPVVDVNVNPSNPIIAKYGRSYSADPAKVSAYARAFVEGHRAAGVLTALKHFPGHGSSTGDTHEGFVDISQSWSEAEMQPYEALAKSGDIDMVMSSHLFMERFNRDGGQAPASLSPIGISFYLRLPLHYDGVVITDDLEMGAIRKHFSLSETVINAVNAGNDILLFSNTVSPHLGLADEILDIMVAEAERESAFRDRIEKSYSRIMALKARLRG